MATLNTYRHNVLVKARREWVNGVGQRRRHLALRTDGYILRRDSTYTPNGWRSPGWKLFRRKKESASWPDFARDFTNRLTSYGYRVSFLAGGHDLASYGFSPQMRLEVQNLKHAPKSATKDEEPDRPGGAAETVKPRDKSRYRLWVCPKCGQKIRAATDKLDVEHTPCEKAFIRKD